MFLYTHLRSLIVRHFGTVEAMKLKKSGVEVIFNGITCVQNFMEIHRCVQKLLVGDTHRQAGDLIKPTFIIGK
jgi:hypothetical protein